MPKTAFHLDDLRQRAVLAMNLTTVAATVACGFGLAFIALGLFVPGPGDIRALVIGTAAFTLGSMGGLLALLNVKAGSQSRLRRHIGENLIGRDLLLVTMQDEACERLPSLNLSPGLAAEKLAGSADTGSFEWRLRRLAGTYASCCKDLGLPPYPPAFHRARLGTFATAMIFMMISGGSRLLSGYVPILEVIQPVAMGLNFIFIAFFFVLAGSVRFSVIEEIVAVLGKQD